MTNAEQNFRRFVTKIFTGKDTPTLTEDERVILRNIAMREGSTELKIRRDKLGRLSIEDEGSGVRWSFWAFSHLFQFIKERRRILY